MLLDASIVVVDVYRYVFWYAAPEDDTAGALGFVMDAP
jgi:hypothetical protein